jgi:hypothetical protein
VPGGEAEADSRRGFALAVAVLMTTPWRGEAEIVGPGGLLGDLTCRLVERCMEAELTEHLGYEH